MRRFDGIPVYSHLDTAIHDVTEALMPAEMPYRTARSLTRHIIERHTGISAERLRKGEASQAEQAVAERLCMAMLEDGELLSVAGW